MAFTQETLLAAMRYPFVKKRWSGLLIWQSGVMFLLSMAIGMTMSVLEGRHAVLELCMNTAFVIMLAPPLLGYYWELARRLFEDGLDADPPPEEYSARAFIGYWNHGIVLLFYASLWLLPFWIFISMTTASFSTLERVYTLYGVTLVLLFFLSPFLAGAVIQAFPEKALGELVNMPRTFGAGFHCYGSVLRANLTTLLYGAIATVISSVLCLTCLLQPLAQAILAVFYVCLLVHAFEDYKPGRKPRRQVRRNKPKHRRSRPSKKPAKKPAASDDDLPTFMGAGERGGEVNQEMEQQIENAATIERERHERALEKEREREARRREREEEQRESEAERKDRLRGEKDVRKRRIKDYRKNRRKDL